MRTAVIDAKNISTKSLRASDYVASPRRIADNVVRTWNAEHGHILSMHSEPGKKLVRAVELAVRKALEKK